MTKLCMDSFLQALNNHPELHFGQLDLYCNALLSLVPIWSLGFFLNLRTWFPLTLHTRPFNVCATKLARHLCMKWKDISLWYLSADCSLVKAWGWIILGRHLVAKSDRLARRSQTSSLVQSSALLSVLIRVYWLDDKHLTPAKPS